MPEKYKSLKELTPSQITKCEQITKLILELKKSGVHPIVIDGGGRNGMQFIRCSLEDKGNIGDEILNGDSSKFDDYIYSPNKYYTYTIDYLVP